MSVYLAAFPEVALSVLLYVEMGTRNEVLVLRHCQK